MKLVGRVWLMSEEDAMINKGTVHGALQFSIVSMLRVQIIWLSLSPKSRLI